VVGVTSNEGLPFLRLRTLDVECVKQDELVYSDAGAGRRALVQDDDGDARGAGVVPGAAGDDPDAQVRQRHGH